MGVRFLETFLEKESRQACYRVDIKRMVHEYRRQTGSDAVVIIDGMSCLRPLYGKLSWLNGGQFKEFYDIVHKFINNFIQLGCRLIVYFDGPVQEIKIPTWKKRRIDSGEVISALFDELHKGCEFIEFNCKSSFLPNGLGMIFLFLLSQHEKCSVITSLKECDEEIARYAYNNKCFAILAQDTDYVIFRAAYYYLSVKNLDLDKMTTLCYDGFKLSAELGISDSNLPLLASLVGNDIINYDLLKGFHYDLKRTVGCRNVIIAVAEYIRSLRSVDLTEISKEVFGSPDKACLLSDSINSYDLTRPPPLYTCIEEESIPKTSEWYKIVQLTKKRYIESFYTAPLYDIMVLLRFHSSTCLEDYRPGKVFSIGNILKELRRYCYGILLHEKPMDNKKEHVVLELVMTGFKSMDEGVLVSPKYLSRAKHPGLINLWTSKDKEIENCKWEILGEVFNVDVKQMIRIPHWLLIPALATKYLKSQCPNICEWELDTLISTNVCVRNYKPQDLAKLPENPLSYRPIWLYTAITRTYATVNNLLHYIGDPIPFECTPAYQYTDGKLYHNKYRQGCRQASSVSLCENQVENLELFNLLKSFIMS